MGTSRHIFKSGGTTIENQVGRVSTSLDVPKFQKKHWFTLVRDPIEHFLSGWGECGIRKKPKSVERPITWTLPYDERVAAWLENVKSLDKNNIGTSCMRHSFPQGNFLVPGLATTNTTTAAAASASDDTAQESNIYPQMSLIGDLSELKSVMQFVGVPYNETIGDGRVGSTVPSKREYFPIRKDLLSRDTIKDICEFVAIDYFLFDFKIPKACRRRLAKVLGPEYVYDDFDATTTTAASKFTTKKGHKTTKTTRKK